MERGRMEGRGGGREVVNTAIRNLASSTSLSVAAEADIRAAGIPH